MFTGRKTALTGLVCPRHAGGGPRQGDRRGASMVLVMAAVSVCVVLSYAVLQSQATIVQLGQNAAGRDLALQAAETGAAVALETMHSRGWDGVEVPLSATLASDASGTQSYQVTFQPVTTAGQPSPADALQVRVLSTGRWRPGLSATAVAVERRVEVIAQLRPRVPGRTLPPGDSAIARDLAANPGQYDATQGYTLFTRASSSPITLDPGDRVEGDLFARRSIDLYTDPNWGSTVRNRVLDDLKARFVSTSNGQTTIQHPHPVAGQITFQQTPQSSIQTDLSRAGIGWRTVSTTPTVPDISFSAFRQYRLYAGGFTYTAPVLESTVSNVQLRPSASNPLGIFYRDGSVRVRNDVVIQGTIVCTGSVQFDGDRIHVCSTNWRGTGGTPLSRGADSWPRLPAVVAERVMIERDASVGIEGAIVTRREVAGAGSRYELAAAPTVSLVVTATAAPVQQPWSELLITSNVNLGAITSDQRYAVWVPRGSSGHWYPIAGVDATRQVLTVVGEVRTSAPVSCRIERARLDYADVRGPICADSVEIYRIIDWDLNSTLWSQLYNGWQSGTQGLPSQSRPLFSEWLSRPENFSGWVWPYSTYGMTLEPTCHISNTSGIWYRWSPPLFESYAGTGEADPLAGYRWEVVAWRELP